LLDLVILSYFCTCSYIIHLVYHLYEYDFSLFYHIRYDFALFIMFSIILFLVYFDYMLGIVRSELYLSIGSYSACSLISWVCGKYCVGMVPIPYLPAIAPYILDRVVDRGSDSPIESFVVHLLSIWQTEHNYYREVTAIFYIFLSNITMHRYNLFLP
jgi:hypothetical protein